MKTNFKPLALAAAVAAVSAGAAQVQAQAAVAANGLGDAAIVPYYTVQGDYVTGVHIINTSDLTQVIKLRLRRASDSMDALDFNIIMSPKDEWTGFIDDSTGNVVLKTEDTSCTAPLNPTGVRGVFPMPALYREGAEEGYIEIIGMGSAAIDQPISVGATHTSAGVPLDCGAVESNFFRVATTAPVPFAAAGDNGILASGSSAQTCTELVNGVACTAAVLENTYLPTENVLKVSYFVRDSASGLEFGSGAVQLADFSPAPMMTNQEAIVVGAHDLYGFLFPDLDGGSPIDAPRGLYEPVRAALGAESVINDWSVAAARNVSTDWVVTLPGQYIMTDLVAYTTSLLDPASACLTIEQAGALAIPVAPCDYRDIPVKVLVTTYDREEQTFDSPDDGLVISPAVTTPGQTTFEYEVNIVEWTAGENAPVLDSAYAQQFNTANLGADAGWAELSVTSDASKTQAICS